MQGGTGSEILLSERERERKKEREETREGIGGEASLPVHEPVLLDVVKLLFAPLYRLRHCLSLDGLRGALREAHEPHDVGPELREFRGIEDAVLVLVVDVEDVLPIPPG
jgi:hypothetical protein